MFCLALAVKHIPSSLPPLVLALLTGLNAAAVGLIFLAAYKLTQLTAVDSVTRIVLFSSAAIATCYISPWLFPVLTVSGGIVTFIWDLNHVQNAVRKSQAGIKNFRKSPRQLEGLVDEDLKESSKARGDTFSIEESQLPGPNAQEMHSLSHVGDGRGSPNSHDVGKYEPTASTSRPAESSTLHRRQYPTVERSASEDTPTAPDQPQTTTPINFNLSLTQSLILVGAFVSVLVMLLVLQATLRGASRELKLVTNLFVGGTILFGGGPVVIPLLQVRQWLPISVLRSYSHETSLIQHWEVLLY
jgi:chromate transport protein ChrA